MLLLLLCSAPKIFAQTTTGASDDDSVSRPRQDLLAIGVGKRTSLASKRVTFDFFPPWSRHPNTPQPIRKNGVA